MELLLKGFCFYTNEKSNFHKYHIPTELSRTSECTSKLREPNKGIKVTLQQGVFIVDVHSKKHLKTNKLDSAK